MTNQGFAVVNAMLMIGSLAPLHALDRCQNSDFVGAVGFYATGFVIQSPVTSLTGPFARLGRLESDGKGNLTFASTASFNGFLIPQNFTGVYNMNADCTFLTLVFLPEPINLPVNFSGWLSDDAQEIRELFVNPPGVVVYGGGRLQKMQACKETALSGDFQFELSGSILQDDKSRSPYASLGRVQADGAGGVKGRLIANYAGEAAPETIEGTYTVGSDCIFELKYKIIDAIPSSAFKDGVKLKGVVVDGGKTAYLMVLDPSLATVIGSMKVQ